MKTIYNILLSCIFFITTACHTHKPFSDYTIHKTATSQHGMVVSAHPLASEVGAAILQQGGNAIDAAIAIQFALSVVYPQAGNIGGGGFMVLHNSNGEVNSLDYRETAPAAAHRDMYLDEKGNVISDKSCFGHLAAGVPGSVDGMYTAYEKYSKLKNWQTLIQPAIALAQRGFTITQQEADNLNKEKSAFRQHNTRQPIFVRDQPWQSGDVLQQKDLANTLKAIQKKGREGFYAGNVADKIIAEMNAGGGIITHADLKNYRSIWRKPITFSYKQFELISMPPPSSGGIALQQLMKIIEPYPIKNWGFQSAKTVHLMVEAERRVYADRAQHLGDSDFYPVPMDMLCNETYLRQRMENFNPQQASKSTVIQAGKPTAYESPQTTHFCVIDADGNAVSATTTLNDSYGSRTVVGGAGFILNNEMDDFSSKPGTPNLYGLVGGEANAIQAHKRMLSSMTPTIVTKNNIPVLVVGTPGGSTIITSVFQTIINILEFNMTPDEAVNAPRFHHQWLPDMIFIEKDAIQPDERRKLEAMGHQMQERSPIGRVELIQINNAIFYGAADRRGDDSAKGN
ncbi:MAG: gamma-glutamyltransferase [Saprospiraceae bacterium]|nr:gamma-glutamyltransferase [Saprospiraceae bacterium]MBP7699345.1 gamma-glutamyltransferase [Saprospiraceae bacterium]